MEPVLTQEELEAIYAAMRGEDLPSSSIDDVSLSAGQEFIRRAESKWNEAMKAMLPTVESILTGALGKRIGIRMQPAEAWLDDEMDTQERGPAIFNDNSAVMTVTKIKEIYVVVGMDLELARRIIERRTGAKPSRDYSGKAKGLTSLEHRLLNDLIRDLANAAAKATPVPGDAVITSMDSLDMWNRRKKGELWVIAGLGIQEMSGKGLRFFAPSELFMPRPIDSKKVISSHLESATIVLAAELGKFTMSVQNLWHLRPGTVISMGTTVGDPLRLTIGGVPKLLGDPLAQRGNVAVKIKKRIERGVI